MDNQNNESKLILKKPIIIIINGNYKKHVTNLNMLYNYKKNKKSSLDQYSVIEIIKDIPVKLHLLCKKETNEEEYNNRYNLLIKFNNLFRKFIKNKYKDICIKSFKIHYTDISYIDDNKHYISFYIVVSHELGVFRDVTNIKLLMKEFNSNLRIQRNDIFGNKFIDLDIYNGKYYINVFTYVDRLLKKLNIYNDNINESKNIYNEYYFMNNVIGYHDDISKTTILDNNIKTLDYYFNKLSIEPKIY